MTMGHDTDLITIFTHITSYHISSMSSEHNTDQSVSNQIKSGEDNKYLFGKNKNITFGFMKILPSGVK